MDDLISAMATSQVTAEPNSTSAPHPHFALYKVKSSEIPQEVRRRKFLEAQKKKRFNFVAHARRLATDSWSGGDDDENDNVEAEDQEPDEMEWEARPRKPPRAYKDQLMLSEWLVEIPSDISTEWLLKLCPVGKRSLVVASMGRTRAYTKSGYMVNTFPSDIPGGNKKQRVNSSGNQYSILDCIYNEMDKTYYVLDVMCWNSHPLFDSETEFRFYWLDSKVKENPHVQELSSANPFKFVPLPFYCCTTQSIHEVLWDKLPFPCKLDGLLFYHKRTHYTSGSTPLVGWLKAYMVPEMLQIEVPPTLCDDKPSSYTNLPEHVSDFYKKYQQRKELEKTSMQYECD